MTPLKLTHLTLGELYVIFGPGVAYWPDPNDQTMTTITIQGGSIKVKESVEYINEKLYQANANKGV